MAEVIDCISLAVKQRTTLLNVLDDENRDATIAEQRELSRLEDVIASGTPRNAREAEAQGALAAEILEIVAECAGTPDDVLRWHSACTSAARFFAGG